VANLVLDLVRRASSRRACVVHGKRLRGNEGGGKSNNREELLHSLSPSFALTCTIFDGAQYVAAGNKVSCLSAVKMAAQLNVLFTKAE
jgi:hypothetical protein